MHFKQSIGKAEVLLLLSVVAFVQCGQQIPGGINESNDNRDKAEQLLLDSLNELRTQPNGVDLQLIEIKSLSKQTVSGIKYHIAADFATTGDKTSKKSCNVEIWHKQWTGFRESKFKCSDGNLHEVTKAGSERKKRSLVGGASPVDDKTLLELRKNVSEAFVQLASGGKHQFQLNEINDATQQVVAGILYKFTAKVHTGSEEETCAIEVWDRPWMNFYQVTVDCGKGEKVKVNSQTRAKRSSGEEGGSIDAQLDEHRSLFEAFKNDYERKYDTVDEEVKRYQIFRSSLYLIDQLNRFEQGTAVYGVTEFADMMEHEYFQRTGLLRRSTELENEIGNPLAQIPDMEAPEQFDWREKSAVTPVKNQGSCGSCWAFSVTGNIEGLNAAKTGKLLSFSEQELLDCDTVDNACGGGLPDQAYKAIETIGGLELEDQYPYEAQKHKRCEFNQTLSKVGVSGAIDFKHGDEEGMAKWLSQNGPISIGINANAMQFYRGGVSHPWKALCNPNGLDHGVLIVGYGKAEYPKFKKTLPYWIVKNSWGPK